MKARTSGGLRSISGVCTALALYGSALCGPAARAQDAAGPASANTIELEEIVVTGTLIRNAAPVGTNVIAISGEDITATGATSSNDLLASIPQITNLFAQVPQVTGAGATGLGIVRPNLRNLGASGSSTTLVLLNGHRLVGQGFLQTTADPSVVPPALIERIDVVPDGGSSIYGSDAIGGVINFVTKPRFDGADVRMGYGVFDGYERADGNLALGHDWGGGSAFAAFSYAWNDNLTGGERGFVTNDHSARGGPDNRSPNCSPGNILVDNVLYGLPSRSPTAVNRCDESDVEDIVNSETRRSVFAGLTQELSENINFDVHAYFSRRDTDAQTAQSTMTAAIPFGSPFFTPIGSELVQQVQVSFADVYGPHNMNSQEYTSYGVTPGLDIAFGDSWNLRIQGNFGRSRSEDRLQQFNATLAAQAVASGALNPFDLGSADPALLAQLRDFGQRNTADQELGEVRVLADGTLLAIPGGDVRVAVGAEYHHDSVDQINRFNLLSAPSSVRGSGSRNVRSVFGEVIVPLVGGGNAFTGVQALDLTASARYDDYSDFGGTTNPKFGVTYRPIDELSFRANWGTSFQAPSTADLAGSVDTRAQIVLVSPWRLPTSPPVPDLFRPTIVLAGGKPGLEPEEADTYSIGVDWTPTPGLTASVTYYSISYKNSVSVPPFTNPSLIFVDPGYAGLFLLNPTLEEAEALTAGMRIDGAPSIAALYAAGLPPYVLFDARRTNLTEIDTDGLDFSGLYSTDVSFGSLHFSLSGNYILGRDTRGSPSSAPFDATDANLRRFTAVAGVGAQIGQFSGRLTYNYADGYDVTGIVGQTKVDAFEIVDLFFSYALDGEGWLSGSELTLNVDNVFDEDPPYFNADPGFTNGLTVGRGVSVGLHKTF